jgi:hypothetical protein
VDTRRVHSRRDLAGVARDLPSRSEISGARWAPVCSTPGCSTLDWGLVDLGFSDISIPPAPERRPLRLRPEKRSCPCRLFRFVTRSKDVGQRSIPADLIRRRPLPFEASMV